MKVENICAAYASSSHPLPIPPNLFHEPASACCFRRLFQQTPQINNNPSPT
jgi:hypothetical protein